MAPHLLDWLSKAGVKHDPNFKGPDERQRQAMAEEEANRVIVAGEVKIRREERLRGKRVG